MHEIIIIKASNFKLDGTNLTYKMQNTKVINNPIQRYKFFCFHTDGS